MSRLCGNHLDDRLLVGYLDEHAGKWRHGSARRHIGSCELCRARSQELQSVVAEFSTYWEVRKSSIARAPSHGPISNALCWSARDGSLLPGELPPSPAGQRRDTRGPWALRSRRTPSSG